MTVLVPLIGLLIKLSVFSQMSRATSGHDTSRDGDEGTPVSAGHATLTVWTQTASARELAGRICAVAWRPGTGRILGRTDYSLPSGPRARRGRPSRSISRTRSRRGRAADGRVAPPTVPPVDRVESTARTFVQLQTARRRDAGSNCEDQRQ